MCLADGLFKIDDALPERVPRRPQRRRIPPLTWVATVALAPVLLYDVWQTVQDVKHRHAAGGHANAVNLSSSAVGRPHPLSGE